MTKDEYKVVNSLYHSVEQFREYDAWMQKAHVEINLCDAGNDMGPYSRHLCAKDLKLMITAEAADAIAKLEETALVILQTEVHNRFLDFQAKFAQL